MAEEEINKSSTKLDGDLSMRVNSTEMTAFINKAGRMGVRYTTLLREFICAFNDGRISIKKTEGQKQLGEIYVD